MALGRMEGESIIDGYGWDVFVGGFVNMCIISHYTVLYRMLSTPELNISVQCGSPISDPDIESNHSLPQLPYFHCCSILRCISLVDMTH